MKLIAVLVSGVLAMSLGACGGGSSGMTDGVPGGTAGGTGSAEPVATVSIKGMAAIGRALERATVSAKCVGTNATTTATTMATTADDGTFAMQATGSLPCMLEVVSPADGIKLHSIATGSGNSAYANITPLTELLIAKVTRNLPENAWTSITPANLAAQLTPDAIESAQRELASGLTGIVDPAVAGSFLTTPFKAATIAQPDGGDAADKVLDVLMSKFGKDGFYQLVSAASFVSIDPMTPADADLKKRFTQALLAAPSPVGKSLLPAGWLITGFDSQLGNGALSLAIAFNASDLKTVTATINGVSTELKYSNGVLYNPMGSRYGGLPGWAGTISLPSDLPQGRYPFLITATDISGKTGSITVNAVSNRSPSITLTDFAPAQIAWPDVKLIASCTDDDVRGCASITAFINGKAVARGTTGIDALIDLKEYDRSYVSIQITAEDTTGNLAYAHTQSMMVESSLPLDKIAEVPGAIWDVDATRILHYAEATNTLYLRDRSSGTDQIIVSQPYDANKTNRLITAVLTPAGVAYTTTTYAISYFPMLYSVENGNTIALGEASYYAPNIAGQYLFWRDSRPWATLSRRDLLAQKTTIVSTTVASSSTSKDGTVAFSDDTYNIGISKPDGSRAWITSDATVALRNLDPVSDGTSFVYRKERSPSYKLVLNRNGVERELTPELWESPPHQSGSGYQIANGWVAYIKKDDKGLGQVWRIDPQGEAAQITSFGPLIGLGSDAYIDSLDDDGTVTVLARFRRYLIGPSSAAPLDIGPGGKNFRVNGQLYVAIGGSLFSVRK